MRARTQAGVALACAVLLPCTGCGGESTGPHVASTVPVRGKVLYQGRPLTRGEVTFEPDSGREAHGQIRPDGTFTLSTFKDGDGAVLGTHRVAVKGAGQGPVPVKYRSVSSSKIEVEVTQGKADYAIDLP